MAINSIFTADPTTRVPSVSTSEDQGATWSAFTKMPAGVLETYRVSRGWDAITAFRPYDMDAFVVTDPDQWSYFYRVADYGLAGNTLSAIDLVEAKYNNGTWTMTKIADISGIPIEFTRQDSLSDIEGEFAWIPSYAATSLGNEVEVAITADGQNLLVKWIDENPMYIDSGFTQRIVYRNNAGTWVEDQLTSFTATDLYVAHRPVNGGTWSVPNNLTDDRAYDHGTRIPPVIPSLQTVPLITLKTIDKSEYNAQYPYLPAINQLQNMVMDAHVDYRTPNTVRTAFFSATAVSVQEEAKYTFRVNSVSPNPATSEAELTFTMDVPGNVSVDVYSTTGTQVANAFTGRMDAGIHGMTINTADLANGSYYVALNIGTQRVTRQLVVIR
jgi:hypothetical protein